MGRFLPCLAFYFKYIFGSTVSSSLVISKCRCGSSAISNDAEFPTVPKLCPLLTVSSSFTNSVVSKFAYIVLYPSLCSIITVKPYLGSFNIDVTTPSADAFITLVLSAFISIPVCVIHSFNVSEYIKFSCANSAIISPSVGLVNVNGFFSSVTCVFSVALAVVSVLTVFSFFSASALFSSFFVFFIIK